ncbi:MAG: hypothetical protein WDZ48_03630 [Pirellulales bacterium]
MLATLKTGETRVSWTLRGALIAGAVAVLALPLVYLGATSGLVAGDAAPSAQEFFPVPTESEKRILDELEKPTTMDFIETPLYDVVAHLKELHTLEIQLDRSAMVDAGADPEALMTSHVKGIKLRSALQLLLRPMDLVHVIRDELLLITTKDVADSELRTRTYPVGDLIDGKDDEAFDNLTKAITTTVRKDSWEDTGGLGTVTAVPKSMSLVISQTVDVHDDVLTLLRALRAARQAASP